MTIAAESKHIDTTKIKPEEVIALEPIPTIMIDGFQGASVTNGSIRFNLFEDKYVPATGEVKRHVTYRLALSIGVFENFVDTMNAMLKDFKASGLLPEVANDNK